MTTVENLALALRERDNFLMLTHARPDGDTVGSAAALCLGLRALGKAAFCARNEELTARYDPFIGDLLAPEGFEPDTVVAVDIADLKLLPASARQYGGRVDFCVDHHPTNKFFAAHTLLRDKASAAGEIIFELLNAMGCKACKRTFEALYLAVATDTGCFRFSNTTPQAHMIATMAIAAGVDFYAINYEFFTKKSRARFEIERELLANLRFSPGGKAAGGAVTREMIERAGANEDDLENLSSVIMGLDGLLCAVLATERPGGESKISVRTRAPADASGICAQFGGGGHARAAGCTVASSAAEALQTVLRAVDEHV